MESLSRPFGIDHHEIFGGSSSIPVLDFSTPVDASWNSKPDYSQIFGIAVELFAPDKTRTPSISSTRPTSQDSSHDAVKQFNMSYHKISPKTNDLEQLHPIPFLETQKQKNSKTFDSTSSASSNNHKTYAYKSTAINPDVNSAASSAAALRKAIEKAQESIRIAKESVGRKKKGLRSFSSKKNKVDDNMEDVNSGEDEVIKSSFQNLMDGEKLFSAKKVIDELQGKIAEYKNNAKDVVVSIDDYECKIKKIEENENENDTWRSNNFTMPPRAKDWEKGSNQDDNQKELKGLLGTEKQQVVEQEPVENLENEMENNKESNEDESKNDHKEEETKEMLCEETCSITIEEIEDDHKSERELETLDEACDHPESDDVHLTEETDFVINNTIQEVGDVSIEQVTKVDIKDKKTTQEEVDDVIKEASSEFQVTEADALKKEVEDQTYFDQHDDESNKEKNTNITEVSNESLKLKKIGERKKWYDEEKEREKNKLAVERAFSESRERAERAAVEKATEEVRQRMMADSKASSERIAKMKLRSERAAVERATSEARQRALEKAMSQKTVSDLHTNTESALRSKAKLEKHNRIMERVAKALAEKEKRDLLAQKEQAERNRLAENLDADIKRWSNGKEGNLRALLSTLQYILGGDSGWQAVSLTEIGSSSAVKKAYRKATLCVHPDKLQQRGASVQHKYICEKVFDLLKAAWNRFNSEER